MNTGTLYVVATPIGNVDDISLRAQTVLAAVKVVAAEDTRHSGGLLKRLGIEARLLSCHDHNETERIPQLLEYLRQGDDIALISDAGTPLVSDPGFKLVRAAAAEGINVSPVPGASAAVAALSVAGLPTDCFRFEGFLPASTVKRSARLQQLADDNATLILYESVHRMQATLTDIAATLGADRQIVAARELTKLHETVYRGTAPEVAEQIGADSGGKKGEYTLIIAGAEVVPVDDQELDRVLGILLEYLGLRQAADVAARLLGVRKNAAYKRALVLRESSDDQF